MAKGTRKAKGTKGTTNGKGKVAKVKVAAETRDCLCGCGGATKSRFVPGHDATLKSAVLLEARFLKVAQVVLERADAATVAEYRKLLVA